ncbi:MAG: hypothetical protein L3J82_01210 [Planctomycetes bacterium]|nr:hypothetical protein [Planctomycetota bacterium]
MQSEIEKLASEVHRPDGSIDPQKAESLRRAIDKARRQAPLDHKLQRSAEAVQKMLDRKTLNRAQAKRDEIKKKQKEGQIDPEAAKAALEMLKNADKKFLEQALKDFAENASEMRDGKQGADLKELKKALEEGRISPEDAKEMAKQARELSKRLQIDAEALEKMLEEGQDFEGLEELAKELAKQAAQKQKDNPDGYSPSADPNANGERKDLPDWARPNGGKGSGNGKDGGDSRHRKDPKIEGGSKEGVDSKNTGEGEIDPDSKEEKLDPNKATDENAGRDLSGNRSDSNSLNTREDQNRLPRRYQNAARKYFER